MSQPLTQILASAAFVLAAALLAWRQRLGLTRSLLIASVRAAAQLAVVGALIALVFRVPALAIAFVAVMVATASLTAGSRMRALPGARRIAVAAIALPALSAVGVLLAVGAFAATPRATIPTAGILIGGAMLSTTLTGRRLVEGLADGIDEIEARLALGDRARDALAPLCRRAIGGALVPLIDQTRSAGLVTLPGTFVGLVLGGASPATAARVQLVVLLTLLLVQLLSALLTAELVTRAATLPGERVLVTSPEGRRSR
ncbi:MAG TPA: ABC transporter permease [Conexibacter sp.]|nr:ABC transporter permease [Conexibacter sp.]